MGTNSPSASWARSDLRARIVSLIVLGVLAGLTAGLATAAFDGARRTGSALERLRQRTLAGDAVVFASQLDVAHPDWSTLAARPEVAALARWGLVFGSLDGEQGNTLFVPMDDTWLQRVDRPIVVQGRMFDPTAADEVIVTDDASTMFHLHVGQVVHLIAIAGDDFGESVADGPAVDLRIVGIVHTPLSNVFTGGAFISPAFASTYGDRTTISENAVVRLRNGSADVPTLRRDASTDIAEGSPVLDFHVTGRRVTATTDVERAMLLLLSVIVAAAGLVFIGQAVARSASTIGVDRQTLDALGMSRREMMLAALLPHAATALVAGVVTASTAIIASRWFPVGLAARVDPDRGIQVDAALVSTAAVAALLLVVVCVALAGWSTVRARSRSGGRRRWLRRVGLLRPVGIGLGARMAFDGGGRRRGAGRPALIGAVAAVAGLVAIVTLDHGLNASLANPAVAGVAWDATVVPQYADVTSMGVTPAVLDDVAGQAGVAAVGTVARTVIEIGTVGVPTFTVIDHGDGDQIRFVTLSGRRPVSDDEVVLGPSTAKDLRVGIGDTVTLPSGSTLKVVGLGLFPSDVHAQFDEGALIRPKVWFGIVGHDVAGSDDLTIAVRFASRADLDGQVGSLGEALGTSAQYVVPPDRPEELGNLHNVRALPTVLAVFLTVLGVLAVGHALFTSVRRRRKDFAVLRALGVTRGGSRLILAAQGSVVALVGLVLGVPIGLIAGRAGWRAITDRVPIVFQSPLTIGAVALVVPAAIIVANALAIIPGRAAARIQPALILRSE